MEESPNLDLGFVGAGISAIRDKFTYQAAAAGTAPFIVVIIMAAISIQSRLQSTLGIFGLNDLIRQSLWWLLAALFVGFIGNLWAATAVGLRATGKRHGALGEAASRLPTALAAWLILVAGVIALIAITVVFQQLASVAVVSFIIAILALPLGLLWVVAVTAVFLGSSFIPALAATSSPIRPMRILKQLFGLVLKQPGITILAIVVATLVASSLAAFFFFGAFVAQSVLTALSTEMAIWGHSFSSGLTGFWGLLIFLMASWGPWGAFVSMIASFTSNLDGLDELEAAASDAVDAGQVRFRQATSSAASGTDALRSRLQPSENQGTPDLPVEGHADHPPSTSPEHFSPAASPEPRPVTPDVARSTVEDTAEANPVGMSDLTVSGATPPTEARRSPDASKTVFDGVGSPAPTLEPETTEGPTVNALDELVENARTLPMGDQPPALGGESSEPSTPTCGGCGAENPPGYRFCGSCGRSSS